MAEERGHEGHSYKCDKPSLEARSDGFEGVAAGCGDGRCGLRGWGLGDEFGKITVAEERDDGDETDGDSDEDGVPTGSWGVKTVRDAQAGVGGGEDIRQEMEGQSAESSADACEDGGP